MSGDYKAKARKDLGRRAKDKQMDKYPMMDQADDYGQYRGEEAAKETMGRQKRIDDAQDKKQTKNKVARTVQKAGEDAAKKLKARKNMNKELDARGVPRDRMRPADEK